MNKAQIKTVMWALKCILRILLAAHAYRRQLSPDEFGDTGNCIGALDHHYNNPDRG